MVTNMGKDLEGGVRQRIHVQEGLCGLGGVPGYKEDARDVRVWKELCSEGPCCFQLFAGWADFSGSHSSSLAEYLTEPKAKGRSAVYQSGWWFYHSYNWSFPKSTEDL